jgi:SAM-dependent methyltransferase
MIDAALRDRVREYYEGLLEKHGATALGVDWKSESSQALRFRQLEHLWEDDPDASLIDYGCGYGALAEYIRSRGHRGAYTGFDISRQMTNAAVQRAERLTGCEWTDDRSRLTPAAYAIASGIFNVKLDVNDEEWRAYIRRALADLASLGTRGFAFNALTSFSDPDKRRADLHYADPFELFDYCRRSYSRFVSVIHDYPLYEFTMLVRVDH